MRFAHLTILLLTVLAVLTGCNREAAPQGEFLAPASAPPQSERTTMREEDKPKEGRPMIEGPSAADLEAANEPNGGQITPEQAAAARKMGPGRTNPVPDRPQTATPTPANTGAPTAGKPVLDYDRPVFSVSKTPCYGKCQQYSLTLTNDQQLILDAKNNMDKKGRYTIRLNRQEYSKLLAGLDSLNLQALPAVFPQDTKMIPADVQATVLRFPNLAGEEQKVEIYSDAPDKLANFLARFEAMIDRKDWVKMGN